MSITELFGRYRIKNRYNHIRSEKAIHSNKKQHIGRHIAWKMHSLDLTEKITGAGKGRYYKYIT